MVPTVVGAGRGRRSRYSRLDVIKVGVALRLRLSSAEFVKSVLANVTEDGGLRTSYSWDVDIRDVISDVDERLEQRGWTKERS